MNYHDRLKRSQGRRVPSRARQQALRDAVELMMRLAVARSTLVSHPLMETDLTTPQLKVLMAMGQRDSVRPGEVAEAVEIAPANLTGIIDRLEVRGLVQRHPDPSDRRALILSFTDAGLAAMQRMLVFGRAPYSEALEDLSDEELQALRTGLRAVVAALEKRARSAGSLPLRRPGGRAD